MTSSEYAEKNWLRFERQYAELTDYRDREFMIRVTMAHAFEAGRKSDESHRLLKVIRDAQPAQVLDTAFWKEVEEVLK